jgi:hypothetical protein
MWLLELSNEQPPRGRKGKAMLINWVPSKKAITQGIVPVDYKVYDIDTDIDPIPDSSLQIMLRRSFRHMFNNESASSWKAYKEKCDAATPPVVANRAEFLHNWRTEQRTRILEGKLGMRESTPAPVYDEVTTEARALAYNRVRKHIETVSKGTIILGDMKPSTLATVHEDKTVEQWIVEILDETKSRNAARFWADAKENVAKRHEQAESLDDLSDVFGTQDPDSESEEEDETETEAA